MDDGLATNSSAHAAAIYAAACHKTYKKPNGKLFNRKIFRH